MTTYIEYRNLEFLNSLLKVQYLGSTILSYKLTRVIGEGGMATVYEGVHERIGTKVAVKILNPLLSANKDVRGRFEDDAKFMASLKHENIVKVLDYAEHDGTLVIIMELLEGSDLAQMIAAKGPIKPEDAIEIFSQVLDAFTYTHEKGVVHRDIKPSNIFIEQDGKVKILDFGIAKLFGTGADRTRTGTQIGTPVYMSPEQVKGDKSIDFRSDIYSLGVTLQFALTGKSPYDITTQSDFEIYNKIVFEELPELKGNPEMNAVIKKATEKDRNLRFESAREMREAIGRISQNSTSSKPSQKVNFQNGRKPFDNLTKEPSRNTKDKSKRLGTTDVLVITIAILVVIILIGLNLDRSSDENSTTHNSTGQEGVPNIGSDTVKLYKPELSSSHSGDGSILNDTSKVPQQKQNNIQPQSNELAIRTNPWHQVFDKSKLSKALNSVKNWEPKNWVIDETTVELYEYKYAFQITWAIKKSDKKCLKYILRCKQTSNHSKLEYFEHGLDEYFQVTGDWWDYSYAIANEGSKLSRPDYHMDQNTLCQ